MEEIVQSLKKRDEDHASNAVHQQYEYGAV